MSDNTNHNTTLVVEAQEAEADNVHQDGHQVNNGDKGCLLPVVLQPYHKGGPGKEMEVTDK